MHVWKCSHLSAYWLPPTETQSITAPCSLVRTPGSTLTFSLRSTNPPAHWPTCASAHWGGSDIQTPLDHSHDETSDCVLLLCNSLHEHLIIRNLWTELPMTTEFCLLCKSSMSTSVWHSSVYGEILFIQPNTNQKHFNWTIRSFT